MALSHSPRIVTDGLVLCLDAANPKSYPGSGTAWNDLSDRGNNLTLQNTPTFGSSPSSFLFNGSTQSATRTGTLNGIANYNNFSVVVAFRTSTRKDFMALVGDDVHTVNYVGFTTEINAGSVTMWSNGSVLNTTEKYDDGNWHIMTCTMRTGSNNCTLWVDGVARITGTLPTPNTVNTSFMVAQWGGPSAYFYAGNIAFVQIYNRTLEGAEILQNYNALRGRFGL
jgi:hypothetical protein